MVCTAYLRGGEREEEEGREARRAGLRSREEGADNGGEDGRVRGCEARNNPTAETRTDDGAHQHLQGGGEREGTDGHLTGPKNMGGSKEVLPSSVK